MERMEHHLDEMAQGAWRAQHRPAGSKMIASAAISIMQTIVRRPIRFKSWDRSGRCLVARQERRRREDVKKDPGD
jgi:hypothetical protein